MLGDDDCKLAFFAGLIATVDSLRRDSSREGWPGLSAFFAALSGRQLEGCTLEFDAGRRI